MSLREMGCSPTTFAFGTLGTPVPGFAINHLGFGITSLWSHMLPVGFLLVVLLAWGPVGGPWGHSIPSSEKIVLGALWVTSKMISTTVEAWSLSCP